MTPPQQADESTVTTGEQGMISQAGVDGQHAGAGAQQLGAGAGHAGRTAQAGAGLQTSAQESDELHRTRLSKPPADTGPTPSITVKQTTMVHWKAFRTFRFMVLGS
ncbi:MAG: hypothetical protein KDB00_07025 [Planctomycetales bacterium]|nr:hypothetical protein [Planctomycetales bacterium]